jgi:uncharacterized membrane protein YraQ (UPF0718 family)
VELAVNILFSSWRVMCAMAPYLLLGFLMAGLLAVFIPPEFVERHLGRRGFRQIAKAALFGIPIPLCSCSVIPVSASLRRHGASKGATISFLTSTPQTGVDSILVTYGMLGPVFAVFRVVIAFITGIITGGIVDAFDRDETGQGKAENCCCCHNKGEQGRIYRMFHYGFVNLPKDIGRAILVGVILSGLLSALVPPNFFADKLGLGMGSLLVMLVLGIPFYVCSTASVPIAYALMVAGVSPGGALVFLIVGPATNAATFTTLWTLIGRRSTVLYLFAIGVCALGAGLLLDSLFINMDLTKTLQHHHETVGWFHQAAAIALLLILGAAFFSNRRSRNTRSEEQVPTHEEKIHAPGV